MLDCAAAFLMMLVTVCLFPMDRAFAAKRFVEPVPRSHSFGETATYVGGLYVLSGVAFFVLNSNEVLANASIGTYWSNLVNVTAFDNDSPNANWGVHVIAGAQTFLFYRARSYSRTDAFFLTALQSALFEFTIEIVQEPASLEDLVNTPIAGGLVGLGLESATISMLNSDSKVLRFFGYLLNPTTLLGWHEGEVKVSLFPVTGKFTGIALEARF